MVFHIFTTFATPQSTQQGTQQRTKHSIEHGTQNATKMRVFFIFLASRAAPLTKPPKMTSRSLPGPLPGGGKAPKIGPKAAKRSPRWTLEVPKLFFGRFKKTRASLFRQERSPQPDLPPKTPREASRGLQTAISDPPGVEISPPRAPFLTPGGPFCNPLRAPFPRKRGNTVPPHFSIVGPAECAQAIKFAGP